MVNNFKVISHAGDLEGWDTDSIHSILRAVHMAPAGPVNQDDSFNKALITALINNQNNNSKLN